MVIKALIILLLMAVPFSLAADARIHAEISTFGALSWDELTDWSFRGTADGMLDIRSPAGSHVQGRLQIRMNSVDIESIFQILDPDDEISNEVKVLLQGYSPLAVIQIPRANLRFRFPVSDDYSLRVTAGIDRVTWGMGTVLNAGDLLFGAEFENTQSLMSFDSVRDETAMLFAVYYPLGDLNYLETVLLPSLSGGFPDIGFRIHSALDTVSFETSYLYRGIKKEHTISSSLQTSLFGGDVYGSVLLQDEFIALTRIWETLIFTAGGFYSFPIGYDKTLTARLEALVGPSQYLNEIDLKIYGEAGFVPNRTLQLFFRGLVDPMESIASTLMVGASWNIFQGFNIQGILMSGFDSSGWTSAMASAGFSYRF